jgi:ER lumen protein retaining receptor
MSCPGDLSHLLSILILIHKMKTSSVRFDPHIHQTPYSDHPFQSAAGISFKSQFLYLVVYISRYLGTLSWLQETLNRILSPFLQTSSG